MNVADEFGFEYPLEQGEQAGQDEQDTQKTNKKSNWASLGQI